MENNWKIQDDTQKKLQRIQRELDKMVLQKNFLYQDYVNMQNSLSFRLGRILTWVPRKIRGGIYCISDHGLLYTLKYGIKKLTHI